MDLPVRDRSQQGNDSLPPVFRDWFAGRGWQVRKHQLALIDVAAQGQSVLLTAPTGGGKTLAGFLPSLIELAEPGPAVTRKAKPAPVHSDADAGPLFAAPARTAVSRTEHWSKSIDPKQRGLHTLYISPLKALAVDIARNLEAPVSEMKLPITVETRTGDTPTHRRQRQKTQPPDILLTTPEQLALLLATREAPTLFGQLRCVILDELHALAASKRGDLLSLDLARLEYFAPGHRRVGLSATVADPDALRRYLVPQSTLRDNKSALIVGEKGAQADVHVLASEAHIPWSGHMTRHAMADVYNAIQGARTALIFVNTRAQAEFTFQMLWTLNEAKLPIALHHGSLAPEQRRKVEAAMARGSLRAVVCTSTLDLGIDWGDVDLVIQLGAPKGCSRLQQRIGRANHRLDEPSRALLVPSNRFEVMECFAAKEAVMEGALDGEMRHKGTLDVLAQHVLGVACSAPFDEEQLYKEVTSVAPYAYLEREDFRKVVDFVATGGYALRNYDRFARLRKTIDNKWRIASPAVAQRYRMNVGTIVEQPMMAVRLVRAGSGRAVGRGRHLGELEEYFLEQLVPGDTFVFAGHILRFEGLRDLEAIVTRGKDDTPKVPSYEGGKFPLSTYLAERVRKMLAESESWSRLPHPVSEWLSIQKYRSIIPKPNQMLVETFPRGRRHFMVCYPFEGRLAHQSLGMLLTRRLERMRMRPMGFVASEYALAVWALHDLSRVDMGKLFEEDMLGDDLENWLAESNLLKRTFRNCAVIAGLIERRFPGKEKSGRQVTFSSDLIYDVLRQHEPDHILLRAANDDAAYGLLDIARLGMLLRRIRNNIVLQPLERVSPLAVPVMLEIGKETVFGEANEDLLREAADALIADATAP